MLLSADVIVMVSTTRAGGEPFAVEDARYYPGEQVYSQEGEGDANRDSAGQGDHV